MNLALTRPDPVLRVERHAPDQANEWDTYVRQHAERTFFHLAAWREVLGRIAGFTPHYLVARRRNAVSGVLPLVSVRSRLFGRSLVSLPFCVEAGVLASDEASEDALIAHASELAVRERVDFVELRHRRAHCPRWASNATTYATFRRELPLEIADCFAQIPRKQRAMIRKATAFGLRSETETTLGNFWPVYATSVRNLGTPVFPQGYFASLAGTFGPAVQITTVFRGDTALASVMSFLHGDTVMPYYGGGLPAARHVNAYDFLYWEVMRRAVEAGLRRFDFGRSKRGTGAFDFKRHWGFTPEPLHYEYRLLHRREVPQRNPANPRFRLAVACWKHLPLPLANRLGPLVSPFLA